MNDKSRGYTDGFIGDWRTIDKVHYMVVVASCRLPKWVIGFSLRGPESLVVGFLVALLPPPVRVLRISQTRPRILVVTRVMDMGRFDEVKDANEYARLVDQELSRGEVSAPLAARVDEDPL